MHIEMQRILFLDYDGTIVGFKRYQNSKPDQELKDILMKLTEDPNTVVIVSGRDRTFWRYLRLNVHLIGIYGLWIRHPNKMVMTIPIDNEGKNPLETY